MRTHFDRRSLRLFPGIALGLALVLSPAGFAPAAGPSSVRLSLLPDQCFPEATPPSASHPLLRVNTVDTPAAKVGDNQRSVTPPAGQGIECPIAGA